MRLAPLLAFAAVAAVVLDYLHVSLMCPLCRFPSPMLPVFFLLTLLTTALLDVFYTGGFKPTRQQTQGLPAAVINLLREPDRSIYIKVYEKGGEVSLSEVAKELGLNKLRAWRAAQRLAEKELVYLEKRSGRLVVRLRPLENLPIKPEKGKDNKQQKQHSQSQP
ncbi:helix-turn-helix transcriptional regulator [Pyrobaculum calidifontis]|uniref:Uncharacterized protein n=1 Tax=Pyrobaculum calidifontis (strain DSM 21063 / JCM 11548 / VA1) TaxID=410359 RepID=A3MU41_PYRCJ|nr:hypothetical protein [Pyrobaculum calidifontis]ABO08158.1 conserved hypothetical protein [Pyrobaculum calidifontis JCM 11548]